MVRKVRASSVSMGLSRSRPFISILSISTADFPRLSNVWTLPSFKSGKMEDDHYGRDSLSQADAASGRDAARAGAGGRSGLSRLRSEEHTSELQSLMRISYAVFCLK